MIHDNERHRVKKSFFLSIILFLFTTSGGRVTFAGDSLKPVIETIKILWKKQVACNLRTVELERVLERTSVVTTKTFPSRTRTIQKSVYKLVLMSANGSAEKTYDLSQCHRIRMVATAYYPGDPLAWRDGTETCLGLKMQRGIVAVDPKIIPLKTRLYISGYGYGYAADTGNAIIGNRIDLGVNNASEEKAWMHRKVTVYILEKADTW
jgi:3D (Asp-Asp-Asp) domain-containing protein